MYAQPDVECFDRRRKARDRQPSKTSGSANRARELSTKYAPVSVKAAAQCFLKVVVGLVRAGWRVGVACDRDFFSKVRK